MDKNIIKQIKNISVLFNVCLNKDVKKKKFFTFITIETDDNILIYDCSNGIDYSNIDEKNVAIIQELSKIYTLYSHEEDDYQSEIEFGPLDTIKIYKNAKLENLYSGLKSNFKRDIIEFKDIYDNKLFISHHLNEIDMRNNSYKISDEYAKEPITIFEKNKSININPKIFKNKLFDLSKLFFDYK